MRDPYFCPKCLEIRGLEKRGTVLATPPESLAWKSFGMCSACHQFLRDYPEKAKENQISYFAEIERARIIAQDIKKEKKFRIYFLDSKIGYSEFVNSLQKITKFGKYPDFHTEGLVIKSKDKVNKNDAEKIINLLKSKDIESWCEEEND